MSMSLKQLRPDGPIFSFTGCTTGSTHVEQQLKELKGAEHATERARQKAALQWSVAKTRLEADQSVFKIYKGVKCFDFSKKKNIIITGGGCVAKSVQMDCTACQCIYSHLFSFY